MPGTLRDLGFRAWVWVLIPNSRKHVREIESRLSKVGCLRIWGTQPPDPCDPGSKPYLAYFVPNILVSLLPAFGPKP